MVSRQFFVFKDLILKGHNCNTFQYLATISPTLQRILVTLRRHTRAFSGGVAEGSQSQAGSEFVGRILTVTTSLKAQNRNAWDYLCEALRAQRLGLPMPLALPQA